ncbi:MAG: coproporphyrinogen dehydrogenase HemZ [Oscillospiraceae bacterium]|nr:coproporphyrinogen dehydrogenase HemZ [Oscillospiraceae bacterium]
MSGMIVALSTDTPAFANDIADVIRLMLPGASVRLTDAPEPGAASLRHTHKESCGYWTEHCEYVESDSRAALSWSTPAIVENFADRCDAAALADKRRRKRAAKQCCYWLLRNVTGRRPPWGSLTGIRPTRLYAEFESAGDVNPIRTLERLFDVRADKAKLLGEIADVQRPHIIYDANAFDIYVSIPYCITKCAYCAFHSEIIPKNISELDEYLDALHLEIDAARRLVDARGLTVRAIYIGGGTPTALDARRLDALLARLERAFPHAVEWTVEAGRPDTIDSERLRAIRSHRVTRVSVNPQTMNDATLRLIGRAHTSAQTLGAFELARATGFDNINMDCIAGLPGESVEDFVRTMEGIRSLNPESVTVHALARKRASKLYDDPSFAPVDGRTAEGTEPSPQEQMILKGAEFSRSMGMSPYYLYRQKNMVGDLENIGYAKPGAICLYNLDMMEETTSVVALGAGAISKRVVRSADGQIRITRSPNMMEPMLYARRLDDMIARKERLFDERH